MLLGWNELRRTFFSADILIKFFLRFGSHCASLVRIRYHMLNDVLHNLQLAIVLQKMVVTNVCRLCRSAQPYHFLDLGMRSCKSHTKILACHARLANSPVKFCHVLKCIVYAKFCQVTALNEYLMCMILVKILKVFIFHFNAQKICKISQVDTGMRFP